MAKSAKGCVKMQNTDLNLRDQQKIIGNENDLSISEVVSLLKERGFHVTERIIRHIEKQYEYINPFHDRNSSGYRFYTNEDINRVEMYLSLRRLNLPQMTINNFLKFEAERNKLSAKINLTKTDRLRKELLFKKEQAIAKEMLDASEHLKRISKRIGLSLKKTFNI